MQILRSAASKQSVSGLIKGKGSKAEMLLRKFLPANGKIYKLVK